MRVVGLLLVLGEAVYALVVPVYLWGWLVGLLVVSALTSLMHIVILLQRIEAKL